MSRRIFQLALFLSVLGACLVPGLPYADPETHEGDEAGEEMHDRAWQAVREGRILPLARLVTILHRRRPEDELVGVELERKGNRWIYEFRLLSPAGELIEIEMDARTGRIIEWEREEED